MAKKVRDAMTENPVKCSSSAKAIDAAKHMAERDIGAVLVEDGAKLMGIVTDRDIVIRAVAQGRDPARTPLSEICTPGTITMSPEDDLDKAVEIMREKAVRRVPVVDGSQCVGILSLGDLAREKDPRSALGQISAAPPQQ